MTAAAQETKGTVADYLDALVWDGTPRLDRWLIVCAGADDVEPVRVLSRRMLVAAVRRIRDPGCRLDQLPVLVGPSGCGKSSALCVLAVVEGWFTDVLSPGDVRRLLEETAGKWIVEMSELGDMSRSDVVALKAFLSCSHDEVRRPYERTRTSVPRSFMFVGTTGQTDFLQDTASNRRFVPVNVRRFDLELLRAVRDQLWAEAVVVEARGEPLDLGATEMAKS